MIVVGCEAEAPLTHDPAPRCGVAHGSAGTFVGRQKAFYQGRNHTGWGLPFTLRGRFMRFTSDKCHS
jgi:hypothetical protein